jgi:hypothetical protein
LRRGTEIQGDEINKIDYNVCPTTIPDSDSGNLRLYYELELLRSAYESDQGVEQLRRYAVVVDIMNKRGLYVDYDFDLKIDKIFMKVDWEELINKPFAGYKDMKACIASVSRRKKPPSDPAAYCATIMRSVEGKK